MYYGEIKNCDIANGEGVRVTLFVSGCTNRCPHCFQPQTWDFCYGQPFTAQTEEEILRLLAPGYINGLTLLGGSPLSRSTSAPWCPSCAGCGAPIREKTSGAFSGFTYEQLRAEGSYPHCEVTEEMLSLLDVLVDGRYVEELKDISLRFRGSSNQRLIDLNATRRTGELCLLPERARGSASHP